MGMRENPSLPCHRDSLPHWHGSYRDSLPHWHGRELLRIPIGTAGLQAAPRLAMQMAAVYCKNINDTFVHMCQAHAPGLAPQRVLNDVKRCASHGSRTHHAGRDGHECKSRHHHRNSLRRRAAPRSGLRRHHPLKSCHQWPGYYFGSLL